MTTTSGDVAPRAGAPAAPRGQATSRPGTVFCRVTVVAPRTRIDIALPTDVVVADLLPMVLELARESSPDGGSRHGGWCLTKVGEAPLDPARTLAAAGILDGDLLQLRRRAEAPPPPLFDDVVDAIADATPDSYRPWTQATARRLGMVAAGVALLAAAVALLAAGLERGTDPGVAAAGVAGVAGVVALGCVGLGAVLVQSFGEPGGGVLVAAGGLPFAFVTGLFTVRAGSPAAGPGLSVFAPPNLLLGSVLALVFAAGALLLLGVGVTVFVAAATAGLLGALAFLVASLVASSVAGPAAGVAAAAVAGLSLLPRLTILLARLPLPQVPGSAEELKEDEEFPDYTAIERQAATAHRYLTGMIIGCAAVAAVSVIVAAVSGGAWAWALAVLVSVLLLLRARTYANGSQAVALLVCGMVASTGVALAWVAAASPLERLTFVTGGLLALAALALVLGVLVPHRRFSPVLRRSVDIAEAVLIAAVLPVAVGVMDLYRGIRSL